MFRFYYFHTFLLLISFYSTTVVGQYSYEYQIDLEQIEHNNMNVRLNINENLKSDALIFCLPEYASLDNNLKQASPITALEAVDKRGNPLTVKRLNPHQWEISDAKKLRSINYSYKIDSSLLYRNSADELDAITILPGQLFGFFKGFPNLGFSITIDHDFRMIANKGLRRTEGDLDTDIFLAADYNDLFNDLLTYSKADTALLYLGHGNFNISVVGAEEPATAKKIKELLRPYVKNQLYHLGSIAPYAHYQMSIHLNAPANKHRFYSSSACYHFTANNLDSIIGPLIELNNEGFFHCINRFYMNAYYRNHPSTNWFILNAPKVYSTHYQVQSNYITKEHFLEMLVELKESEKEEDQQILFLHCLAIKLIIISDGEYHLNMLIRDLSSMAIPGDFLDKLWEYLEQVSKSEEISKWIPKQLEGITTTSFNDLLEKIGYVYSPELHRINLIPNPSELQKRLSHEYFSK